MLTVMCACGAPAHGPVCQRGHRLEETWGPEARAAAIIARREHKGEPGKGGLKQWSADDGVFDGKSWDVDKLRAGTPQHLDINPREGGTGVNVWVPGHHYSSANVTEQRGGIRGNQRTGRWEVSDADSYPLKSKEGRYGGNEAVTYDSPEEALNVAIAHAHKSHIAYDEGVHDAVGGPKVGPVMPVDPAALAKRRDADESSLRKMAQGSMSPGAYDQGGRARLRAHGEASSDPELRKGAALIAAHKLRESCECGAPANGSVCQRGHRLTETWSPAAREAAAAARKAKREANMPEGLQWNKRKGALEGKYQGVPLERGTAYQGELAGGRVFTAHWTGEKDSDEEPIFKHVETGERRTFRHGKFFGRLSDVAAGGTPGAFHELKPGEQRFQPKPSGIEHEFGSGRRLDRYKQ